MRLYAINNYLHEFEFFETPTQYSFFDQALPNQKNGWNSRDTAGLQLRDEIDNNNS